MENGIGIAEDARLEERNSENSDGPEPSVKENVRSSLDGSNCSHDGVIEEDVVDKTRISGAGDELNTDVENSELIGTLEGNPDKFMVMSGVTVNPDILKSEENHDGHDAEDGDYKEIVESSVITGQAEKLEKSNQELEDGQSDKKKSFLEALISGDAKDADAYNTEKLIPEDPGTSESTEVIRAQSHPEKPEVEKSHPTITKIPDDRKLGDGAASCNHENGTSGHEDLVGSLDHESVKSEPVDLPEDHIREISVDIKDQNGVTESEAGIRPESESIETDALDNEQKAVPGNMHAREYQVGDEAEEKLCISSANPKDVETIESKTVDVESMQGDNIETQHVDQNEKNSTSISDTSDTDHAKERTGVETNLHAVDDSNIVKEIAEVIPQSSSPELSAKGSSHSQPKLTNDSAEASAKINEIPEQAGKEDEKPEVSLLGNKDEQQEASLSGNKQQKVRPSIDNLSSAGNSSTAAFSPARPASLEDASEVQEPVTRDNTAIAAQEPKPAADKSFSAQSVATHSSGVGHNNLSEPTPQNINHRSRSATDTSSTNSNSATPARPAGLGRAAPLLEPSSRVVQQPRANGAASATQNQLVEDPTNGETEEYDETREKLQMIRVKFLRLARRLGQTPHNVVVAQVLYRLGLAEQLHGRSGGRGATFSFDRASAMAEQLEAAGQEPLDFTCTIMVLGKSGVGKSATINSIFDEVFFGTDAFELGTKKVQDIVGNVQGIRVRVIDTPGLLPSWSDQRENERILRSVKKFIKKTPPDIILYLDRLDMQSRDFGDMPLLRTITETFGPSIWFNAIVVLSHAASAPPEGPNGTATSYDMFVTQRSHVVQQAVRQAAGDMRLMNPVSLVENHSACRTNRAGQRVLPNGQVWKPHLLLLSFASKILAEANTLLKLQDTPPGRPFAPRTRSPPLPFLLSSILQSRPEVKLPSEQFGDGDDDDIDDGLDECSDEEEDSEYDELPPFKPLSKAQLEKLSKVQIKAYYDELEYREKLFMKQQLKEERKRRKMMKKLHEEAKNMPSDYGDNGEEETSSAASVPVPMPDLALPASFDSDNPTHRYRSLDSSNPWVVRAVLEPNGWDHDIGYDGINVERLFVVKEKVPISFSGHISKDKKDANLQMEFASSVKHGKGKATSLGFDMQSLGKDYAYTLRSETRFSNHRINKAIAGISGTVLGDVVTAGMKLEDKLIIGKRGQIVVSGGGIYGRGEVAYGGSLEATLRDKDHPLGRFLSTFGLSIMDWHGDVAIGCNSQTQIPVGRHSNLFFRFNINNKGSGQFSLKVNSTEQLQIVLVALVPLAKKILGYSQQSQYA
ncbi:hypothetical protein SASPL_124613 [Salvia splendens]|uniref:AIG1-type G domain-containing protein n=1 Tax=Salvia splendens TaxID=180675 RepID=A0A8X8ZP27_SALSN|nr:translocase of chloroplast 120, chloroplastic-like [Salvia splendens]KAG6411957.1 hypothetical protein SASPL_124613 [Salvia splendens]